jgi:hypothetical protein
VLVLLLVVVVVLLLMPASASHAAPLPWCCLDRCGRVPCMMQVKACLYS